MTRSPTTRLLLGLLITLAAVTGFSSYALNQLGRIRQLQTKTIDLNRHDSLLLLQIQSDVNTIGLKLRDMTQMPQTSGIGEYRSEFARLRADLEGAIHSEVRMAPVTRKAGEQTSLTDSLAQFWRISDQVFRRASTGDEAAARALVSTQLSAEQSILAARVSALLERNNEAEERADVKVALIYDRVERDIYAFLAATMGGILVTSLYFIYSNRQIFAKLESFSQQRRVLAARLITVQEEVLRSVSRELHDEFGQILTAVGAMLARAERKGLPADSPLRTELTEVRMITHNTLEKMRSLSQILHPAVIDDYGLAKGLEWYAETFQRQTGIETTITITGKPVRLTGQSAIHCFRIVQEALNNAAKHSGTKSAKVEMVFSPTTLTINVIDFGRGMAQAKRIDKPGIGLIAMQERAELLAAKLSISSQMNAGTTVSLVMPLRQDDHTSETIKEERARELATREL